MLVKIAERFKPERSTSLNSQEYVYFTKHMKTLIGEYITKDTSHIKIKLAVLHPEAFNKNFDVLVEHIDSIQPEFFRHLEEWLSA